MKAIVKKITNSRLLFDIVLELYSFTNEQGLLQWLLKKVEEADGDKRKERLSEIYSEDHSDATFEKLFKIIEKVGDILSAEKLYELAPRVSQQKEIIFLWVAKKAKELSNVKIAEDLYKLTVKDSDHEKRADALCASFW